MQPDLQGLEAHWHSPAQGAAGGTSAIGKGELWGTLNTFTILTVEMVSGQRKTSNHSLQFCEVDHVPVTPQFSCSETNTSIHSFTIANFLG